MFDRQSVEVYDVFYDVMGKDYEWEAGRVLQLVRRRLRRPQTLLDVACGTGRHLSVFARTLSCVGADIEPAFFDVAAARCPGVRFVEADMVAFDLGERFDVVTCLFSSIAYVGTVARLRSAVRSLARHLAPGGVLVVEPWFEPDEWRVGEVHALFAESPVPAARFSRSDRRRDMSILDFHYLVGSGADVSYFTERHELRLFTRAQYPGRVRGGRAVSVGGRGGSVRAGTVRRAGGAVRLVIARCAVDYDGRLSAPTSPWRSA